MDRTNLPSSLCEVPSSQKTVGKCGGCFGGGGSPVRIQNEGFKSKGSKSLEKSRPFLLRYPDPLSRVPSYPRRAVQVQSRRKARGAGGLLSALFPASTLTSVTIFFLCAFSASLRARASSSPYDALFSLSLTFSASLIRSFSRVSFIRSHSRSFS